MFGSGAWSYEMLLSSNTDTVIQVDESHWIFRGTRIAHGEHASQKARVEWIYGSEMAIHAPGEHSQTRTCNTESPSRQPILILLTNRLHTLET